MWNPLSYIRSSASLQPIDQQHHNQQQKSSSKQIIKEENEKKKKNYMIEQFQNYLAKIKQFQSVVNSKTHDQVENTKIMKIFSQIIQSLQKFSNMIAGIKSEYEQNLQKIKNYDNIQRKLQNHSSIISHMQQQNQKQIDNLLQRQRQRQLYFQTNTSVLKSQIQSKENENIILNESVSQLKIVNQKFLHKITEQRLQNAQLIQQIGSIKSKLKLITQDTIDYQIFKKDLSPLINPQQITLQNLLFSAKHRANILCFLQISDIISLSKTNKLLYSVIRKVIPIFIYKINQSKMNKAISTIKNQSIYFKNVLLDGFQNQNIKINAIKYLFFKNKPGTYLLTMFQQDISKLQDQIILKNQSSTVSINTEPRQQSIQQNKTISDISASKRLSWRSFFNSEKTKKQLSIQQGSVIMNQSNMQNKKFSLAQLKSSEQFKKIQGQLSKTFHNHFFSLKLPQDLQQFGRIMQQQLCEMKIQLKDLNKNSQKCTIKQWTSKLLTLSKFLYLQSQQLWSLSNNIYQKLITFQKQNNSLKSLLEDTNQNNNGLRRLAQQLAKNKIQMEKRIWQSQRKVGSFQLQIVNLSKTIKEQQKYLNQNQQKIIKFDQKYSLCQNKLIQTQQKLNLIKIKYKQKVKQLLQLKEQISKIEWLRKQY